VAVGLLVNTYNTGDFAQVGHALARICTGDRHEQELIRYAPACAGSHTGFVMGIMYVLPGQGWHFKAVGQAVDGRTFEDCMPSLQAALQQTDLIHNMVEYVPGQRFKLHKGDTFAVPSDQVVMGLGWDPRRGNDIDLDAAILMFDQNGKPRFTVYWGALAAPGVQHMGDNLTGAGDGDDEQVVLRLEMVPVEVTTMLCVVNIYTQGQTFRDVDNEFCRLIDARTKAELCRFEMDYMDSEVDLANSLIMSKMFRNGSGQWVMQVLGYPLKGPRTAVELANPAKHAVSPLLSNYSLTKPCYSPVPIDPNPKKKPAKATRSAPSNTCACCMS